MSKRKESEPEIRRTVYDIKFEEKTTNDVVNDRFYHLKHLIYVKTDPPMLINNKLLSLSPDFVEMAAMCIQDPATPANKYGDKYILMLPHDDIPYNTWEIFRLIFDASYDTKFEQDSDTIIDDIMYLFIKYNIHITPAKRSFYTDSEDDRYRSFVVTSITNTMIEMFRRVCNRVQRFPRLNSMDPNIPSVKLIVDSIFEYMFSLSGADVRIQLFIDFHNAPYLHERLRDRIALRYLELGKNI